MTTAHLDHDALADLAVGLLDEVTATSAEAHLADCADCRNRAAEVAEVSRVLAEAPTPPMPAHLVERLDAAIAAEVASHAPAFRRPHRFQLLAAAAAAVVAVGGGAAVAHTVWGGGGAPKNSSAISQPRADEASRPRAQAQPLRPVPYAAVRSGTNYTRARLATQIGLMLSEKKPTAVAGTAAPGSLDGCVRRVSAGHSPLLVDSATFEGTPATIIVLPGDDVNRADVWVVGRNCSLADSDVIIHLPIPR